MQRGYRYALTAPAGRNFDPGVQARADAGEMLTLGVFGGKYMTDCAQGISRKAGSRARNSRRNGRDKSLNFFGVDASQPLAEWRRKGWIHADDPRGWFQWYCRYYMGRRMPRTTRARSAAGRRSAATSGRSRRTASPATCSAARASARRCCIGPMTAGRFDGISQRRAPRVQTRSGPSISKPSCTARLNLVAAPRSRPCGVPGASAPSALDELLLRAEHVRDAERVGGVIGDAAGPDRCRLSSKPPSTIVQGSKQQGLTEDACARWVGAAPRRLPCGELRFVIDPAPSKRRGRSAPSTCAGRIEPPRVEKRCHSGCMQVEGGKAVLDAHGRKMDVSSRTAAMSFSCSARISRKVDGHHIGIVLRRLPRAHPKAACLLDRQAVGSPDRAAPFGIVARCRRRRARHACSSRHIPALLHWAHDSRKIPE